MSATYPMDMVRGRLTVQTEDSPHRYRGMFHAFQTIIKEEGAIALYKGWVPSVIGVGCTADSTDGLVRAPVQYNGMVDAFRKTVKNEGLRALYKGLVPNSVKVVPSIAIAFVTYELMKDLLGVEIRISE
ncbi:unnamed protein product [Sphagnum troendelagicum]